MKNGNRHKHKGLKKNQVCFARTATKIEQSQFLRSMCKAGNIENFKNLTVSLKF